MAFLRNKIQMEMANSYGALPVFLAYILALFSVHRADFAIAMEM